MVLYEEPLMRYMCPVTWFLSLAFADGVFRDLSSYKDLSKVEPPPGSSLYRAKYTDGASERPIMRNVRADGTISEDKIWTYDCFNLALRGTGQRAGYKENLSAYCFRRAFAHAVQSKYFNCISKWDTTNARSGRATAPQLRTLLGHKGEETAQYYVSGFVGIDSQSIVHEREQRLELYKESSSMMANRNLLAPKPQGSTLIQQSSARTVQLLEALEALGEQDVEIIATTQLSPKQASKLRRQSRNRAYQKDRRDFYEGTAIPTTQRELTSPLTDISRGPSRYLMALLKFEPERKSVIEMMFSDDDSVDLELSLDVVLAPLI